MFPHVVTGAEEWRPVVGFEGFYQVSDFGRVRSLDRTIMKRNGVAQPFAGKVLSPSPTAIGYPSVTLSHGSGSKPFWCNVHSLVMAAFVGPRPEGHEVRHLSGVRKDSGLSNLTYGTRQENSDDRDAHGRTPRGETHARAKLTDDAVRLIRRSGASTIQLAATFGVHRTAIGFVRQGKTWRHVADELELKRAA